MKQINPNSEGELHQKSQRDTSKNTLQKRAKSKDVTNLYTLHLVNANEKSKLSKAYWNTYYCGSKIQIKSGKIVSQYCGNRWCLTCNRMRTAKYIQEYFKPISELRDPKFVTLTAVLIDEKDIKKRVDIMNQVFNAIKKKMKYEGYELRGICKLEVLYKPDKDKFHPHYHLIVEGIEQAILVKKYWLEFMRKRSIKVNAAAQDIRDANIDSLKELFKYFTKLVMQRDDGTLYFNAKKMDTLFQAIMGVRTVKRFGIEPEKNIDKKLEEEISKIDETIKVNEGDVFTWEPLLFDWLNKETGELICGYEPDEKDIAFKNNIRFG